MIRKVGSLGTSNGPSRWTLWPHLRIPAGAASLSSPRTAPPVTHTPVQALLGSCVADRNFKRFNLSEFSHPSKFNRRVEGGGRKGKGRVGGWVGVGWVA